MIGPFLSFLGLGAAAPFPLEDAGGCERRAAGAASIATEENLVHRDFVNHNGQSGRVVLIGDAAGHNDPIIGQGTSITLRDVRIVQEIILSEDWRPSSFENRRPSLLSSRPEDSHLRALPDPYVNLSIHTAPDVRPVPWQSCQWAKSVGFTRRSRSNQSRAPLVFRRKRLNLRRAQRMT
jgi:hypothetical protein